MSELPARPNGQDDLEVDERWLLVQRIVGSLHFQKALQLRDILLYISRRALEDNPSSISEHEVGCDALGRRVDFDTNEDNIVRVQMRHLRKRLEDYFLTEGRNEPLVLTIPKGSYVPRFERRTLELVEPIHFAAVTEFSGPNKVEPLGASRGAGGRNFWRPTAIICLVLLGALAPLTMLELWNGTHQRVSPVDPLFSKLFAADQPVNLVISDSCLVLLQDILDIDIPLSDYVGGGYPGKYIDGVTDDRLRNSLKLISNRQYTSLGDMTLVSKYLELGRSRNANPRIRFARHLNSREFKAGNFIVIGSRRGIPWIQLFEPQMNFVMEQDKKTRKFHIRNKDPHPGERAEYGAETKDQSYAVIALLPNLSGTGYVLLLSGLTMEMTEVTGELMASQGFTTTVTKMLHSRPNEQPASYIEILLEANTLAGMARNSKIVTYRLISPPKPEQ